MKPKALFLANPNGRNVTPKKNKRLQQIERLQDLLSLGKGKVEIHFVVTENLRRLEEVINKYKNREISLVGIIGGDGTVFHTRTLLENIWGYQPTYAFFPEGTMNNIQRSLGLGGKDSSARLARHFVDTACSDNLEMYTVPVPSLDINGKKGFNAGFGLIPRLLWMYYGHSAKHYRELEEALQTCSPKECQAKYKEITGKSEEDFFDLLSKERGLWGATKAALRLLKGIKAHTDEAYLLHKSLAGSVIFDGEKQTFPQTPLGAYVSCYEEVNLGLGRFNPIPSPEANKEEGKFQVVVPYGSPFSIVSELPRVVRREKLTNAVYQYISTLELPAERFAHVDGEPLPEKGFTVRSDGTRKVFILPVTV